jgi:hypothetical protein
MSVILREYLYVDATAVRGLIAQLDSGIVESETSTSAKQKTTKGGFKGFAEHAQEWGDNRTVTKAMGDALFPSLEVALESEGLLEDISETVATAEAWNPVTLEQHLPPGKIVRVSAPGYLIDARFVAAILGGFAVTHHGLVNMGIAPAATDSVLPPSAKKGAKSRYKELPGEADSPEGVIPLGTIMFDETDESPMSGEFLRGIAQVARGMFAPGLHLMLVPDAASAGAITIRLQEGRQYLDTDTEVLFARYGVGAQEWTVVGTIGHHPLPDPDLADANFKDDLGNIQRAAFGRYVNQIGTMLGNLGFTDLPQSPGFSIVPWAVYRTLGTP